MYFRMIAFITLTLFLTACRGNLPRPDNSARASGKENTDTVASTDSNAPVSITPLRDTPQTSGNGSYLAGDGPGTGAPSDLNSIPNAVPRAEPLHRYANRPYSVLGKTYTPLTTTGHYKKHGIASWYGKKFHGQRTSIGEVYDMYGMTAASTTLPIPSYAKVTNLANQKSVIVRVNDRGPFLHERIIDLSYTAAAKLGLIGQGQGKVEVESLNPANFASVTNSPIYKEPVQVTPLPADTLPSSANGTVYLQLGAFSTQRAAEDFLTSMRAKLSDTGKQLILANKNGMVKVHLGPYDNADTARTTASKLESRLGFKPVVSWH